MSQFLKQSTACTIMFGPFVDMTDGVTLEVGAGIITSIDHATTGIFISKNGAAAAIRNQAVTASVLDAYGMFKVTLDTTDTGTVGTLDVLMAEAATFLPVHKTFMVLPANVYDSLMGTDKLQVDTTQVEGGDATDAINAACDTAFTDYDPPTKTEMDTAHALLATPANVATELGTYDAPTKAELDSAFTEIKGATWAAGTDTLEHIRNKQTDIETDTNELQTDWANAGRLDALIDLILADTNELQGDWTNAGRLDAILDLILADTNELQGDWADAGRLDALIDLILADTGELQTDWADGGRLDLILDAAGGAGDPWITALPGAYGAGTAGKIIGDNINAPIGTVDTVVDGIQTDLSNVTDGLGALKALIDAIPTTAMRGTDNVVLAGPTKAEMDTAHALLATEAKQDIIDTILDKLDSALELDGAVYRYTTNALEQGPGGASAASIADAVWNEAFTGHESANTFGRIVSAIMGEWEITGNQLICKGLGDTVLFTYNLSQDGNPTEFNPDLRDPV